MENAGSFWTDFIFLVKEAIKIFKVFGKPCDLSWDYMIY
jgi:hypothetical protein